MKIIQMIIWTQSSNSWLSHQPRQGDLYGCYDHMPTDFCQIKQLKYINKKESETEQLKVFLDGSIWRHKVRKALLNAEFSSHWIRLLVALCLSIEGFSPESLCRGEMIPTIDAHIVVCGFEWIFIQIPKGPLIIRF
jgi:hypothetical protein